ncbi:ATP-binding cassette domain-containing protein [Chryseosolibacter indicus]|uniref:ATP-binding cassette domain-containing protein n=1 Tax=Chryseosolibacter indicus TaxID=2782351 RepID=A0ABS5VQ86_9BACT|nr:ATP-binding cassette domain-containing protein [Chryseosolibacter indicus]MBT1703617.1 ATP-binding cassette domain-containing protein [Chryseosolibacter indicus]
MPHTLEFDSIELSFDTRNILSSIYMRCQTGEVVGLLGRNGSGKSCMMKVVFGAMNAEHKSVRIDGVSLQGNYAGKRLISYLPQEGLIPSYITIKKAFEFFNITIKQVEKDLPEVLQFLHYKPRELSGGYLRLIEAFLVLKSNAPFCILDEPFSGIMPLHVERLIEIINEEKKTKGIIITDHLYRHVTSIADALYVLSNGKLYKIKDKEQLVTLGYISAYE